MDLWYKANKLAGTLPAQFADAAIWDITDSLDIGYHCLLPDFSDFEADGDLDIGLGVYHLKTNCYETIFHNIQRTCERDGDGSLRVTYQTPYGNITTRVVLTKEMRNSGITLWVVQEHAVKSEDDWEAAAYIFENAEIVPRYDRLEAWQSLLGDRAEAVAYAHTQAGAMHLLVKDLMDFESFCCAIADDEEGLAQLGGRIEPYMDRLYDVVVKAPSRLVFSGGNFDSAITAPPFFRKHMLPQIKKRAAAAHRIGKYLICHTDGENDGLMDDLISSGMDIADSICPAPMTRLGFEEYYQRFRDKITIWGGIPSIVMLEESMSDRDFWRFTDAMFAHIGDGRRLILSIADTLPPAAKFDRLEHIARLSREYSG
ncbi:MAG: hypothetical protein FWF86_05930 [Clostridia bacterium]|nr:hypothetical protein [Clostridia bacterium]